MAGRTRLHPTWQMFLLLLVAGGIIGGWLGDALLALWPALTSLGKVHSIGIPDLRLDLHVFTLNFGFMLNLNFFTIIGFILAYILYRRL